MSASPAPEAASLWREYRTDEGRLYWSHKTTKASVWEKPDDLKTPFERALAKTEWKQYTSKDKPYYVNSRTKETKWNLPPDLVELKKKVEEDEKYMTERTSRRERGMTSPTPPARSESPEHLRASNNNALAAYSARQRETSTPSRPVERIVIPHGGFTDPVKAEEAFIHLLKRDGIDETWTWDQTMRKIIMDPLYKALDTLAQKKAAFEKHINSIISERRAAKEARMERLRPLFVRMFENTPEIKSYSTMKTAAEVFKRDKTWREADTDEQRQLLDEWTSEQRRREEDMERRLRQRNMDTLAALVKDMDLNVGTRWRAAHEVILASPAFRADSQLQTIETIDILTVWDTYSRQLEQEHETESRRVRVDRVRKGRKAREGFIALLHELKHDGVLTRSSKWKDLYPKIKKDERYENLLGMQGSSPLDLWMDVVDDMQDEAERAADKVSVALKRDQKVLTIDTKIEEYNEWVKDVKMDDKAKKEAFEFLHEEMVQRAADEARRAERKRRHRMDDLRYALRKVPRIDVEMTYDEAEPFMKDLPEFKDIPDEEDRKAAYEKFIKRQQEKLREEMEEGTSERDRDRDRDRRSSKMDIDDDPKHRDRDRRAGDHEEKRSSKRESKGHDEHDPKDKERERERERRDSFRDKEKDSTSSRSKHRDSDRERERERDTAGERSSASTRDSGRKRFSQDPEDHDRDRGREHKKARRDSAVSTSSKKGDDVEEGEI